MAGEYLESTIEYKYTLIECQNSIRLLHLHPAVSFDSPLNVSLQEVILTACLEFGALSYTWATEDGDSTLSSRLLCDGACIKTTANCEMALRRLRPKDKARVLWVDAVCIDQSSNNEKSLQVALMSQIYSQAAWVGVWVGEVSSEVDAETSMPLSELGMTFIHDLAVEIAERSNSGKEIGEGTLYNELIKDRRAFQEHGIEAFAPKVQGLWDILHRRWWGRLWTLQEVALAKSVILMCGVTTEDFHNLTIVIDAMARSGQEQEEFDFNTTFITSTFHQFYMRDFFKRRLEKHEGDDLEKPGERALEVLNATRNTRAADARDKIYGILGFFRDAGSDHENILPLPDYTKSAAEVYADVSRAIITNTANLNVMSSCHGFVKPTVLDLPSWVADWNATPLQFFDVNKFNAANDSSVIYEGTADDRRLRVKGRTVDFVQFCSEIPDEMEYDNEISVQLWREWTDLAFSLESHPTGEDLADILKDTLCWGSTLSFNRLTPGEYQETFGAWMNILRSQDALEVTAKKIFEDPVAHTYSRRASFLIYGRSLGTTANSYLALMPISASANDKIVIFNGGKVPYVLRAEGDRYKVVGHCYVYGIMDGEALRKEALEFDELEWFTLC